jgi:hypothetical protein
MQGAIGMVEQTKSLGRAALIVYCRFAANRYTERRL